MLGGVTQTGHGEHRPCRSLPPQFAGCVFGLLLVTEMGRGKGKLSVLLGDTRRAEFAVYCFADNFCACMARNIHMEKNRGMMESLYFFFCWF